MKFMHLMNSIWNICGRDVVTAFDLTPFKAICDLGGKFSLFFQLKLTDFPIPMFLKYVYEFQGHFLRMIAWQPIPYTVLIKSLR